MAVLFWLIKDECQKVSLMFANDLTALFSSIDYKLFLERFTILSFYFNDISAC